MSSVNHCSKISLGILGGLASSLLLFGCSPTSVTVPPEPVVQPDAVQSESSDTGESGSEGESTGAIATTQAETERGITQPTAEQAVPTSVENAPIGAVENALISEEELAVTKQLGIAGVEDAQAVKDFLAELRDAAIANDREAIVSLVQYPFTTYDTGTPLKTYEFPVDLLADFEQVVTQPVLDAMSQAQYASLFPNDEGVMIGNGEVWFGQFDEGLKIQAINGN